MSKPSCGHPECQELADFVESDGLHANRMRDVLMSFVGPIIERMGPEVAAIILRGFADRVQYIAEEAGRWNHLMYIELKGESDKGQARANAELAKAKPS